MQVYGTRKTVDKLWQHIIISLFEDYRPKELTSYDVPLQGIIKQACDEPQQLINVPALLLKGYEESARVILRDPHSGRYVTYDNIQFGDVGRNYVMQPDMSRAPVISRLGIPESSSQSLVGLIEKCIHFGYEPQELEFAVFPNGTMVPVLYLGDSTQIILSPDATQNYNLYQRPEFEITGRHS